MHIVVLAKVVPDYEVPSGDFELANNRAHARYTRMIGLYDENAVEMGVQLKEKHSGTLTIISYGVEDDIPVLRKALAMGADQLFLVTGNSDNASITAANLKIAFEKLGNVDLVLAGQQSADMDRGMVHGMTAQMLGYPFIPQVSHIEREDGQWKVDQITENGIRKLAVTGAAVLSITSVPANIPRIPAVREIFAAKKKPVEKLTATSSERMDVTEISVEIPKMESVCEFLPVDDLSLTAKTLLTRLKEERYI
jgi:electron transfer flavoprotein beta subunit